MKSTEYQKQLLEQDIQRYSQVLDGNGNPVLSPKDAMTLREIDNYKLACWYLATTVEKNRKNAIKDSERLQAQNQQVQQASAKQAAEQAAQLQQQKLAADKEMEEFKALQQIKVKIVEGSFEIAAKLENPQMPSWLGPIIQQLMPNLQMPIAVENDQMQKQIQAQQQQEQQEQMINQAAQERGVPPEQIVQEMQQQNQ
jgi:hypothetical protein